jgi:FK506-binding protein 4/5
MPIGVDEAVMSMKKGEQALVTLQPHYAYGAAGNAALNIPANAKLKYELELIDWEKEKNTWEMSKEEKMEAALKAKKEGNDLYALQKYERAIKKYKKAASFLPDHEVNKLPSDELHKIQKEILVPVHLNHAACLIKIESWKEAKEECETVHNFLGENLL